MRVLGFTRFLIQNSCYSIQTCKNISFSCKQFVSNTECKMYSSNFKTVFNQTRSKFNFADLRRRKSSVSYANIFVYLFNSTLRKMPVILKDHSVNIVKLCAEQCEFIIAQRIRRSQQIFCLYMKIWDEMALRQLLYKMRRNLARKGKHVLLGATVYNWDQERITDEEILRYCNELEVIKELKRKKYCVRADEHASCDCFNCLAPNEQEWSVFVNEADITVWKKEESNHIGQGLYCYKMYGRYEDVTALDFLEAQVDLEYRLSWDENAVKLYTIETEPSSNSDIIYWETKWPKLFSNRDYVFKRRFFIDQRRKLVTLVNKCTEHHKAPLNSNKQRVTEYWSYMVIKPFTEVDEPGIEFSLTYFDNPGISVPSSLSLWVTVQGMPVFLQHLRDAAKRLAVKRLESRKGGGSTCKPRDDDDRPPDPHEPPSPPSPGYPPTAKDKPCPGLPKTFFERLRASVSFF